MIAAKGSGYCRCGAYLNAAGWCRRCGDHYPEHDDFFIHLDVIEPTAKRTTDDIYAVTCPGCIDKIRETVEI